MQKKLLLSLCMSVITSFVYAKEQTISLTNLSGKISVPSNTIFLGINQKDNTLLIRTMANVDELLDAEHAPYIDTSLKQTLRKMSKEQKECIDKYHEALTTKASVESRAKLKNDLNRMLNYVVDEDERNNILTYLRWIDKDGTLKPRPHSLVTTLETLAKITKPYLKKTSNLIDASAKNAATISPILHAAVALLPIYGFSQCCLSGALAPIKIPVEAFIGTRFASGGPVLSALYLVGKKFYFDVELSDQFKEKQMHIISDKIGKSDEWDVQNARSNKTPLETIEEYV